MPFNERYARQAALLIRLLPHIAQEDCFALKGGTAINLFVRDMPRLSVDIDLTYLPVAARTESLRAIDAALKRIAARIGRRFPGAQINRTEVLPEKTITKLLVRHDGAQVKIEVTPVLRGCVYEPDLRAVWPSVEALFGFAEIRVVSFADLYAGKIVAALDRQHPRDLFDVRDLLGNEGITENLRNAFLVYILSHNRPLAEVLNPGRLDITPEFAKNFAGMTAAPVAVDELMRAREELIEAIVGEMPQSHRRFLLSVKRGEPDWSLLKIPGAAQLPAVRWRLENLRKLDPDKRALYTQRLAEILGVAE